MGEHRFADEKLQAFYDSFLEHLRKEEVEGAQQTAMYDALFRQEDKSKNITAGIVQLMVRTAEDVKVLRVAADRQKTFLGGVVFAVGSIWFFATDILPTFIAWLKRL